MNKTAIALAVAASITGVGNVSAASMEDRMMTMEQRLQYLEQRIASQDKVIAEKDKQISELTGGEESSGAWFSKVEVGGVVEVEYAHTDEGSSDSTDLVTATVELGIAAQINDWVSGEIVLLYEEEDDNDGSFNVDTAMVSIAGPDANWFINAGQYVVPFGMYGTNMVSDPITLDYGETGDTNLEFGMSAGSLSGSVYAFHTGDAGDTVPGADTHVATWGAALNYETETDSMSFAGHLGYLSRISATDGFEDSFNDDAAAWVASAELGFGDFVVIGEYLSAMDNIVALGNDEPSFFNLELGYNFGIGELPATIAIGYQGTDDFDNDMDNIEETVLGALTVEIMDGTSLAAEYRTDEAYDGTDSDTLTGLLAVEF